MKSILDVPYCAQDKMLVVRKPFEMMNHATLHKAKPSQSFFYDVPKKMFNLLFFNNTPSNTVFPFFSGTFQPNYL